MTCFSNTILVSRTSRNCSIFWCQGLSHFDVFLSTGTDDDLEYYVRECGDILGVTPNLALDKRDAKHIIEHIFTQVVEFKKLNQVGSKV